MDQNSKLQKFETAVFAEIDAKTEIIKHQAEDFKNSELEKNKDIQLLKSYNEIQKKSQEIRKKFKRDVAKFGLDSKRNILIKRNEITKKVFDNVTEKLNSFYNSAEYDNYMQKKLKSFSDKNALSDVEICVGEKDFANAESLKAAYSLPCSISLDKSIQIGGFILKDNKKNIYFDETLSYILSEQKEYFIQNSELFL